MSVTRSIATTLTSSDPERAAALAPGNGRVAAILAFKLAGADASRADRFRSDNLARQALRQDATAVAAAATLGLNAQVRGDVRVAKRLFAYAEALSRRDLTTQIWAIEESVGRGDVAGALRHYDTALRTSRTASGLLFPVLSKAIAEAPIRDALVTTLRRGPNWSDLFIEYVAANGTDPRATASLFQRLSNAGVAVSPLSQSLLINTLAARNALGEAWGYYKSIHRDADPRRSRNPSFALDLPYPTVFDWTPITDGSIAASIQGGDGGGSFSFSAPAGIGGPMLRQLQVLPPGDYILETRGSDIDQPDVSRPYWSLTCKDGRELLHLVMLPASRGRASTQPFAVPTGCPVQTLTFIARPFEAMAGLTGQLDHARIYPSR